ncbi:atp-dependent rna helicase ddx1 [Nannochloropsis oceanica]
MAGGFESLGLGEELIQAVEGDLNWLLPTDVQDEAIPLILGGGDVMAAAETGSGKTAAFSLPVLQLVMETKRREAEGKDGPAGGAVAGRAKSATDWRLSGVDRDGMLGIEGADGGIAFAGAPRWVGGRATLGVSKGKAYYEATLLDQGLGRVGWSTTAANYILGTDKYGLGFGGTGMKSQGGKFDPYGESFGQGDVIGCFLDLEKGVLGFSKNGKYLGDAFVLEGELKGQEAWFPAVALKQARMRLTLVGPFRHAPPQEEGFQGVAQLPAESVHIPVFAKRSAEVVGGSGGTGVEKSSSGSNRPLAIIIEPARDLAEQVYNCICDYSRHVEGVGVALVVGGVEQRETKTGIKAGCDIVVGTTGKLMDLIKRGLLNVDRVRFFILDEADRLLETGNRDDIMTLYHRLPKGGVGDRRLQICFFSATLHSPEITELAEKICDRPTWVDLKGKDSVPESVHHVVVEVDPEAQAFQALLASSPDASSVHVATDNVHSSSSSSSSSSAEDERSEQIKRLKPLVLLKLIEAYNMDQCLIFCRTNLDCDLLETFLVGVGGGQHFRGKTEKGKENVYSCCVLAGMRSMQERRANLQAFKDGDVRFLICTDVAARGIDIQGLPYVINMTLPDVVENYIHRVGRVGRADSVGLAISLVAKQGFSEKVWYHSCASRGKGCVNRKVKEEGGCTIWFDEADSLRQVEERLHCSDGIPRMGPPEFTLPKTIEALLGGGKFGEASKNHVVNETVAKHVELLQPSVKELVDLEFKSQTLWLSLRQRYRAGVHG